jgi:uncharacterized protein (TIGR02302 family)
MSKFYYKIIFSLSFLALLWERLWSSFWAAATCVVFFAALTLMNIVFLGGAIGQILALVLLLAALFFCLLKTGTRFIFPAVAEVERRMERQSALGHRPIETLQDTPAEGVSADGRTLWQRHLQKTAQALRRLKIYLPQSSVAAQDKYSLRYAAVIFLVVGLVAAGDDGTARLSQSFTIPLQGLTGKNTAELEAWITPPDYTRLAPIFLSHAPQTAITVSHAAIAVPSGSILKLRLSGYSPAPRLRYAGKAYPFTVPAARNFIFEKTLTQSGELKVSQWWRSLGAWNVTVAADAPPVLSLIQLDKTPRAALKITYAAADDYGIQKLEGTITAAPSYREKLGAQSWAFEMPSSSVSTESQNKTHVEDLTAHLWAGLPVMITLSATDATGQTAHSLAKEYILPERAFSNLLARQIVQERKSLLWTKDALSRRTIAENLLKIAEQPSLYKGETPMFLSLMAAAKRLVYDGTDAGIASVQDLMWDIALRLEDGGLSLAERDLRQALQNLAQGLNDKSLSKQALQELTAEVQQKMQAYVRTLAREISQRLQQGHKIPLISPALAKKFNQNVDIGKLLEQMQQMAQAGSRQDLQKMAESLQNSLDNFDMKKFDAMQESQVKAMEALQSLEEIIHRQQSLFDKTDKASSAAKALDLQAEQKSIQMQLDTALQALRATMPQLPDNFAKAGEAMTQSEKALGTIAPRTALPFQKTALDELQKGQDDAARKMSQAMQASLLSGLSFGQMPSGGGEGTDPLGRKQDGQQGSGTDKVEIPSEKERRRVQEIIQELRARSNDPHRAKTERDYLDRLLAPF